MIILQFVSCVILSLNNSVTGIISQKSLPLVLPPVDPSTCSSTGSEKWAKLFNKKVTTLQPGSPCNDFKGYCDVFMRCRLVDADGPLARLKKAIFNPELYENIADWIVVSTRQVATPTVSQHERLITTMAQIHIGAICAVLFTWI